MATGEFADARFAKYAESGAYHWREIGRGLIAHNAFTAERYRRVIEGAALRDGDRVLDYGCGDGALLGALHRGAGRRHYDLHGFDPNTLAVELAAAALPANGVQATIHGSLASLPAGHFDRVICTEVIEHASDPDALLRELARVLKPGGRAVVSTPIRMTEHPEDVNHVREWFPSEFAAPLRRRLVADRLARAGGAGSRSRGLFLAAAGVCTRAGVSPAVQSAVDLRERQRDIVAPDAATSVHDANRHCRKGQP